MGRKWRKQHREKVIFLLACGNLVALQIGYSLLVPSRKSSEDRNNKDRSPLPANAKNDRSHRFQEPRNVEAFLWELQQEALKKESSLRFDWTNLPPMTPLGRAIEQSQSQCLDTNAVKEHGPQHIVRFHMISSGMGSSLHTWMDPLCHAVEHNKVLVTGGNFWLWNDKEVCYDEFQRKKVFKAQDWPTRGPTIKYGILEYSSLWCYFGWHESALRCPPGTLAWNESVTEYGTDWWAYKCDDIVAKYGRRGMHAAASEWLFQNVSQLVIQEAERQIREEAFPVATNNATSNSEHTRDYNNTFQRWIGMPDASSLITVHLRWGDKDTEMDLVSIDEVINATVSLLTPEEMSGRKSVHIYVATEDRQALMLFREAALPRKWQVHSSGPISPDYGSYSMTSVAHKSKGKAGLQSLAALLIALEANRYVLTRGSNWSRLIDELRKSVLDSRCGNCTVMIDLREGEM